MNNIDNSLNARNVFACALLSADVYSPKTEQKDQRLWAWERLCEVGDPSLESKHHYASDFFARFYGNPYWNETIIAYRGTDNFANAIADGGLVRNEWTYYDRDAMQFFRDVKDRLPGLNAEKNRSYSFSPTFTGHSLGGYVAQILADAHWGLKAIVFDAPGISGFLGGLYNPELHRRVYRHNPNVYNITSHTDSIHIFGRQVGHLYYVPSTPQCSHDVDSYLHTTGRITHPTLGMSNLNISNNAFFTSRYSHCAVMAEHAIDHIVAQLQNDPGMTANINRVIAME